MLTEKVLKIAQVNGDVPVVKNHAQAPLQHLHFIFLEIHIQKSPLFCPAEPVNLLKINAHCLIQYTLDFLPVEILSLIAGNAS